MLTNINKIRVKKVLFLVGDILFLYFSLFLTLIIRFNNNYSNELYKEHILEFSIIYFLWIVMIFSFRFYETNKPLYKKTDLIVNIFNFSTINLLISVFYFYIRSNIFITPKTILIINIALFGILFYIWRTLGNRFLYHGEKIKKCLVITNRKNLIKTIKENQELEFSIKAYLNPNNEINDSDFEKIQFNHINYYIKQNNIQTILIDDDLLISSKIVSHLFGCIKLKLEIIKASDFYEKFIGKVSISNINELWFVSNLNEGKKHLFDLVKNILDKLFSVIFLVISILFVPFIVIAIKLDSKGPVLFKQVRTGKNNRNFLAMKFRTMGTNAEKNGPQWSDTNDPRVTKIGKFLRLSRLDEIPQLINIFKGEMNLVGPRPERPEFIKDLRKEIPFYDQRLLVKPGLTGWAQINYPYGSTVEDAYKKLEYDLYYVKNRNFILDISIVLKTIHTISKKLIGREL